MQSVVARLTQSRSQVPSQQNGSTPQIATQQVAVEHPGASCGAKHDSGFDVHAAQLWLTSIFTV